MYDRATRTAVLEAVGRGGSLRSISIEFGVSRATIRDWARDPGRAGRARDPGRCFVCAGAPCPVPDVYTYLLGQYLGDGYLVTSSRVPRLRIACADDYPGVAAEVDDALGRLSGNKPGSVQSIGCTDRYSHWTHWPCLLPQHGPGLKHTRRIELTAWQRELVAAEPWPLLRGLFHSDGCRALNRVVVRGKAYCYPRWFFSNESTDILRLTGETLDAVGVAWRYNRPNSISVARKDAVARLDGGIGPKR